MKKFTLKLNRRNVPSDELIDDLLQVASHLEKNTVTLEEYRRHGSFHPTTLSRRFGTWFNTLDKAGLGRTRKLGITENELFENLVNVWTKLGKQPSYSEMTPPVSEYSAGTYANRFGSWTDALLEFVNWANQEGIKSPAPNTKPRANQRTPRKANWRLRAQVLMRDEARCQMCGASPSNGVRLHIDHITPWSAGGETVIENLQVLCEQCNIGKSNE